MANIKILSDSTCDLSKELIEKYEISIVPLYVNLGGNVLKDDGVEINAQIIYDYVDKTDVLPGTIGVPVEDFRKEFVKWRELGFEIVCHTISSDMSCSFQNAKIASDGMDCVYIVDTRSLSTGVGHLVLNSAELAQKGIEAAEIARQSQALAAKVNATFVIDTLDYLKKGGRCSAVALLGANLFKIKPMIVVEKGNMKVGRKFRGSLIKVLEEYVDAQLQGRKDIRTHRIFITHSGCSPETINAVVDRIKKHIRFDEVVVTTTGATITAHCGPNTLGILFIEK
jgi:DegV family protein with EDD domain